MGTQLQMPDGSTQVVDNELVPQAVANGAAPPATIRVQVRNATGSTTETEVPYDTFVRTQARDQNVSPVTEDTIRSERHLQGLEDETSLAGALGRNALEELSFGAYKPSEDQALADTTYHPAGSAVGAIGGALLPMAIPGLGEVGIARDVAEAGRGVEAAQAAGKAGRGLRELSTLGKAAEFVPGRALAQVGAGISESLGGGALGHIVGGGVEEAGRATLRAALDKDVDLSGESLLNSTLFGMAGGGVGYGVAKIAKKANEAVEDLKGRLSRVSKVDDEALVRRLNENREPTPSMLGKTDAEHASAVKANLPNDISLAGANQAVIKDVASLERQVQSFRSSPLAPAFSAEANAAIDRGLESAALLKGYAKQSPEVQARIMASYGNHLQDIDAMANAARHAGLDTTSLPSRFMPGNVAARQAALSALPANANAAEDAAHRLAVRLTSGTERSAAAGAVADSLISRIPVLGKVLGKAGESPLGSLAVLETIMHGGLGHIAEGAVALKGVGKLIEKAYEVPGRGLALSAAAGSALGKLGLQPHDRTPVHVVQAIRSLSPDEASQMAVRGAQHIGEVHTDVALAAGQAAGNRQSALQKRIESIFPSSKSAFQLGKQRPTSLQVRALEKTLSIAGDPTAFARLWASGKLSQEDLAFANQVWPSHVARAKDLAISWLSDRDGESVSRPVAHRLETLLGSQAVGARRNDSGIAAQASIAAANARAQQARKSGPPPGATPGGPPSTSLMSPALAASSRPSD